MVSNLRQLKAAFDTFDELVEAIGPGLSRTHLFAPTADEIPAGTRVRLEIGTARKGAMIRGVAKVAGPGDDPARPGLHLHIIHLDPGSTRLVDSIVRGETAASAGESSGPSPFDISATGLESEAGPESKSAAAGAPIVEPETEDAVPTPAGESPRGLPGQDESGREARLQGWVLGAAVAVLAGALFLVFELASRDAENPLLTGRDRQATSDVEPAGSQVESIEPPGEAPATRAEIADPEAEAEQVEQVVLAWADAWSRQDPRAYLELYAPDYSPPGLERGEWQRQRRARILAPESLEVTVRELEVELTGTDRARARFFQLYVTGDKRLGTRKTLELERLTAGWKIVAERVETAG